MGFGKKIIQEVELQGAQVKREFQSIRAQGVAAFADIKKAGAGADLGPVENAAKRAGAAYGQFGRRVAATTTTTVAAGRTFADILRSLRGFNDAGDQAAEGINKANNSVTRFGSVLRLLGRAAGIREVSKLGRAIGIVGRAFTVAAPFLFVAGIAAIADVSANAAAKVGDLAAESKRSTDEFQQLSSAEVAVGGNSEDAAKGFKGLNDLIKDTASNAAQNEEKMRGLANQMRDSKEKTQELARGFTDIARTSKKAFDDIARGLKESNINFEQSLRKIQQERADILSGQPISEEEQRKRKLADLDEQEANLRRKHEEEKRKAAEDEKEATRKQIEEKRKLNKELDEEARKQKEIAAAQAKASEEAERNATALDKLGIKATTTGGKLRQAPEILDEIADALQRLGPGAERDRIEFDLIAAGLDRKLLPALRRGKEGLAALTEEGKRIRPPFSTAQIQQADDFKIALGQVLQALGSVVDKVGQLAQPTLTSFLQSLRDTFIDNRDAIAEWAGIIGGLVTNALRGVAVLINTLIVPAFQGLSQLATAIAEQLNKELGSNLTGPKILTGLILALAVAFGGIPVAVTAVLIALGMMKEFFDKNPKLGIALAIAAAGIAFALGSIPIAIGLVISAIILIITKWDELTKAFNGLVEGVEKIISNFFKPIIQWLENLLEPINKAIKGFLGLGQAAADARAAETPNENAAVGFAGGGRVIGRGTSTSDSIPAWLSNDEHVIRAKAARYYGHSVFKAFNEMRVPRKAVFSIRGFRAGGPVRLPTMAARTPLRLAKGGAVPSPSQMRPLTLDFGALGTIEGLLAPESVSNKLMQINTVKLAKSGGRKPSSYGSR